MIGSVCHAAALKRPQPHKHDQFCLLTTSTQDEGLHFDTPQRRNPAENGAQGGDFECVIIKPWVLSFLLLMFRSHFVDYRCSPTYIHLYSLLPLICFYIQLVICVSLFVPVNVDIYLLLSGGFNFIHCVLKFKNLVCSSLWTQYIPRISVLVIFVTFDMQVGSSQFPSVFLGVPMTSAFVFCLPILPYLVLLFSCVEAVLSPRSAMSPLLFHFFISSVSLCLRLYSISCFSFHASPASPVPSCQVFESVNLCLFISCFILLVSRLLCHVCNFASLVLLPQ